jgi:hypothetical protein
MPRPRTQQGCRCRFCGITPSACPGLPLSEPNGAMLLHHMSQSHPAKLRPYLAQMEHSDDSTAIIVQAYEVVDGTP